MSVQKDTVIATLRQSLASCSKFIEEGDYSDSVQSIDELVKFLNSISEVLITAKSENEDTETVATEISTEILQYLALPSTKQEVIDALAFEVPKAIARFGCVSRKSLEVAGNVVDLFVERCSPRDMLSIVCEALGSPSDLCMDPCYLIPLLSGLMKVITLIQRRHYEQVKAVVPVVLNVIRTMSLKSDDEDTDYEELFQKATGIAKSIWAVCVKLESKDNSKLRALLGLYVLQIMALISSGSRSEKSKCLPVVLELSDIIQHSGLSYIGLVTGCEVDVISEVVFKDELDDCMDCFSQVKLGAALAVLWGYTTTEVAVAAKADLAAVIMELQGNRNRRWEAIGMLKHIFLCANLPWALKKHAIEFLLQIMEGIASPPDCDNLDYSMHMPTLYTSLQALQMVIMYSSDAMLRKNAFGALKKVLADVPSSLRFDVLRALITNSESSSMIGILMDLIREEMRVGRTGRESLSGFNGEVHPCKSFWSPPVLELVEMVLRPPKGGPPSLPENSDAVLSALNLYRYVFITETTGNSNYTGILSKDKLQKAYKEWLLPLRTLVMGTVAENQSDEDQLTVDMICALNPVELVLYRCIELVEEKLKHL